MTADMLRDKFLRFFKTKKHKIVESDSLVPADDPTVLFTPAGMNQFKKEFMGYDSGFKRAVTSQRCLRTDDLDKVGKTSVHHTFFEMLGNFSFGDYFKKEAIAWAWEFLTAELKISPDKLWVSVYRDDDEAFGIWKNDIKIPESKILKLGDKDNFWPSEAKAKGPNGPCGPCSEIFFDFGKLTGCDNPKCDPACSCGRFAEIWNLVFTQFDRKEGGILQPLPQKNIDTGMGLERLTAVMENVTNNFQTSLFKPIVKEILSKAKEGASNQDVYAVVDHIRAVTFCIYDGVVPSNEARGYVVRKLIRKSALHLRNIGFKKPFLHTLIPCVAESMQSCYPQLARGKENIAQLVLAEEKAFIATLDSSEKLFKEKFFELADKADPDKAGLISFELHDTYGIPFELTKAWLEKHGLGVSEKAFYAALEEQRARSKQLSAMKGDVFDIKELALNVKQTKFLGYKAYVCRAKIIKIICSKNELKRAGESGQLIEMILDQTPFYGESGGQVGDTGQITRGRNIFKVIDTKKFGKVIVHIGRIEKGSFKAGEPVKASIDIERRLSIGRNHTATHLLQAALRRILGQHVQQQGSLVEESRFRFDFKHFKGVSKDELNRIESLVNSFIIANHPVKTQEVTLKAAKKSGALAFFGEKYEGRVRVVSVQGVSKEFCGGTHLSSTGQIGLFKLLQEGSVASGIRRIEATTGSFAYSRMKEEEAVLDEMICELGVPFDRAVVELEKRTQRIKELEKELHSQKLDGIKTAVGGLTENCEGIGGIKFVTKHYPNMEMGLLRSAADQVKNSAAANTVALLTCEIDGKVSMVASVTPDLCDKGVDAANLIKAIAPEIGGSGGGRKDFAQAGGNKPENLKKAVDKLRSILSQLEQR